MSLYALFAVVLVSVLTTALGLTLAVVVGGRLAARTSIRTVPQARSVPPKNDAGP